MARIRKRYNQVPHPTQDTTWESKKNTLNITNKSQEVSPFPAGDHNAAMNRRQSMRNTRHKKHKCLGYFWSYFPSIICNAILCPLYNLITVRSISRKLNTLVKHIQTTCHAQEPRLLHVSIFTLSNL